MYAAIYCCSQKRFGLTTAPLPSIYEQEQCLYSALSASAHSLYAIYVDSFSGHSQLSAARDRLLEDAQCARFQCIFTLHTEQFFHNQKEATQYLQLLFPLWGMSFVPLSECGIPHIPAPFSPAPPYGYRTEQTSPEHWIPDPPAASAVRQIFQRFLETGSLTSITSFLLHSHIPAPQTYRPVSGLCSQTFSPCQPSSPSLWNLEEIRKILSNPLYCSLPIPIIGKDFFWQTHTLLASTYNTV